MLCDKNKNSETYKKEFKKLKLKMIMNLRIFRDKK